MYMYIYIYVIIYYQRRAQLYNRSYSNRHTHTHTPHTQLCHRPAVIGPAKVRIQLWHRPCSHNHTHTAISTGSCEAGGDWHWERKRTPSSQSGTCCRHSGDGLMCCYGALIGCNRSRNFWLR